VTCPEQGREQVDSEEAGNDPNRHLGTNQDEHPWEVLHYGPAPGAKGEGQVPGKEQPVDAWGRDLLVRSEHSVEAVYLGALDDLNVTAVQQVRAACGRR